MRFPLFVIALSLLGLAFDACAQEPQAPSSSVPQEWQMTLDAIQTRAQTLMGQNNQLQLEYHQLNNQLDALQHLIADQRDKNAQLSRFLQERHGVTDQQMRIAALNRAIKAEKPQLRPLGSALDDLKKNQADLEAKIKQLQDEGAPQDEGELGLWHKQLEDANRQEALLAQQLKDLKSTAVDPAAIKAKRRQLLQERKAELVEDINAYDLRLNELRKSALGALSWEAKKKEMAHDMAVLDNRNAQLRGQLKVLKEDIKVLKTRVAWLQRQIIQAKGK